MYLQRQKQFCLDRNCFRLNLIDGSDITVFRHEEGNSNSISNNNITALTEDNEGLIWIGTTGGVNSFDLQTRKFNFYPLVKNENLKNLPVNSLLSDTSNNLFMEHLKDYFS